MQYIIGCDETGYGAVAGGVYVCSVKAPKDWTLDGLNDSKKLTEIKRYDLFNKLIAEQNKTIQWFCTWEENTDIDRDTLGICHKRLIAMVIDDVWEKDAEVIIDGNIKPQHYAKYSKSPEIFTSYVRSEPKADGKYPVVMAASIIAKCMRDSKMKEEHWNFPEYNWQSNVGYLSKEHIEAIKKHGFSQLHRKSYNYKFLNKEVDVD